MNDWDRNNLNFILSLSPEQLKEWYIGLSDDDMEYAMELMDRASLELDMDYVEDVSEASTLLEKFTLKG